MPEKFISRMERLLGAEAGAFLAEFENVPRVGLRVNPLKIQPEAYLASLPFAHQPNPWLPEGAILLDDDAPGKHPHHAAGVYYLQEPSAGAVVQVLAPQPGERVLDLAAAPGGKATQVAAALQGQGLLVANEIHPQRVWDLAENLERWGVRNAIVLNETPERLAQRFPGYFDRVLVDAPCSGEGMFRKSPAALAEWSPELVQGCALRQGSILSPAAQMVRPGGWLVYSTCTFAPEENEGVISQFLQENPKFSLVPVSRFPGFQPGRQSWYPGGPAELAQTVRIFPHASPGEGHFIALLRCQGVPEPETPTPKRTKAHPSLPTGSRLPAPVQAQFSAFWQDAFQTAPDLANLALVGSYVYRLPDPSLDLHGLKVIHPGWWLGEARPGRFEPSHALALAARPGEVRRVVSYPASSPEIGAYLSGEVLPSPGVDGWTLVCVDGFSLGWGKRVRGILKNHYPKGLRWKGRTPNV